MNNRPYTPYRFSISNLLILASANVSFRKRLLSGRQDLSDFGLCPEDAQVLDGIQATTLGDFASQVRSRLQASNLDDQGDIKKTDYFNPISEFC
jgi:hypothetical protein